MHIVWSDMQNFSVTCAKKTKFLYYFIFLSVKLYLIKTYLFKHRPMSRRVPSKRICYSKKWPKFRPGFVFTSLLPQMTLFLNEKAVAVVVVGLRNRQVFFTNDEPLCTEWGKGREWGADEARRSASAKIKRTANTTSLLLLWAGHNVMTSESRFFNATGPFLFWLDVYVVITDESTDRTRVPPPSGFLEKKNMFLSLNLKIRKTELLSTRIILQRSSC